MADSSLLSRLKWALLQHRFMLKRCHSFLSGVAAYEETYMLRPYQQAMKAVALLISGQNNEARNIFSRLAGANAETPNQKYIKEYCRANILALNGQLEAAAQIESEIAKLDCDPELRKIFPLE